MVGLVDSRRAGGDRPGASGTLFPLNSRLHVGFLASPLLTRDLTTTPPHGLPVATTPVTARRDTAGRFPGFHFAVAVLLHRARAAAERRRVLVQWPRDVSADMLLEDLLYRSRENSERLARENAACRIGLPAFCGRCCCSDQSLVPKM